MFVNYNDYFFIILFSIGIISSVANLQENKINKIKLKKINSNKILQHKELLYQSKLNNTKTVQIFAGNNDDNSFGGWINNNVLAFVMIIIAIVIIIVIIIVLIFYCRKVSRRNQELLKEVNKVSFQSGIRESSPAEDSDKLI